MSRQTARLWLLGMLALGLAVRLVEMGEPLIDKQAWRQTDTAAIARNFYEEGYDLLYPRVDWRGNTPGFVEMNFPLYPFIVAAVYGVYGGVHEGLGRLISALFSLAAAFLLFVFARRIFGDERVALWAVFFFLFTPLSIYFGRVFMPEPLMLLLSVAALLLFHCWAESGRLPYALGAAASAALCFMVKIPTLYLGFALVGLALERWGWRFLLRPALWVYALAVLLPAAMWYAHAADLFAETGLTFGIWNRYGYDKWDRSVLWSIDFYKQMGWRFIDVVYTPVGAAALGMGAFALWKQRARHAWGLWGWALGLLLYLALVPEGNRKLHYYQLPFVPLGALLAARGVDWLYQWMHRAAWMRNGNAVPRVVFLGVVSGVTLAHSAGALSPYYEQPNNLHAYYESCFAAGKIVDTKVPSDALLVVGDLDENAGAPFRAQSPTMLYYCHRKGWQLTPDAFSISRLDSLAEAGADFFLVATAFAMRDKAFWRVLVERGVSTPASYPHLWRDEKRFLSHVKSQSDASRHFTLVPLRVH